MPFRCPAQFGSRTRLVVSGILTLALALALASCSSAAAPLAPPPSQAVSREIVVSGPKWAQGVTVSLHDTLIVLPPARYEEWRVHAASGNVVRLLTSGNQVRRPGAAGWRLEAVGRGVTTVTFVPFVPSGKRSSTANEPHFALRVTVQ